MNKKEKGWVLQNTTQAISTLVRRKAKYAYLRRDSVQWGAEIIKNKSCASEKEKRAGCVGSPQATGYFGGVRIVAQWLGQEKHLWGH